MKKNDPNPEILDDNYFPEKTEQPIVKKWYFLRIISYTLLSAFLYIPTLIAAAAILGPMLLSTYKSNRDLEIYIILFVSYLPFIFEFWRHYKNKNLMDYNWKLWVCLLSFCVIMFLSMIGFWILNFRF